jgi:hypothetical protein
MFKDPVEPSAGLMLSDCRLSACLSSVYAVSDFSLRHQRLLMLRAPSVPVAELPIRCTSMQDWNFTVLWV